MAQNIVAIAGTPILRTTARSELKGAIPSEGRCGYSRRRVPDVMETHRSQLQLEPQTFTFGRVICPKGSIPGPSFCEWSLYLESLVKSIIISWLCGDWS